MSEQLELDLWIEERLTHWDIQTASPRYYRVRDIVAGRAYEIMRDVSSMFTIVRYRV